MRKLNIVPSTLFENVLVEHASPAVFTVLKKTGGDGRLMPLRGNNNIDIFAFVTGNNAPAGAIITTKFYKGTKMVESTSTTYGSAITKDTFTKLATHTSSNINSYDSYETSIKFYSSTTLDFYASAWVDDYLVDDSKYLSLSDAHVAYAAVATAGATVAHGSAINVSWQLSDIVGNAIDEVTGCKVYVTSDAAGVTESALGVPTAGTNGSILEAFTANTSLWVVTKSDGSVDINFTKAAAGTLYAWLELPNGRRFGSGALVWS